MHNVIATQGNHYWIKQKNNKAIIKYKVDTSNVGVIARRKEYYDFIPIGKKRHAEIELIQIDEETLKRKKAKEDKFLF